VFTYANICKQLGGVNIHPPLFALPTPTPHTIPNVPRTYYMSVALSAQFEVMVKGLPSTPKWGPKTAAMYLAGPLKQKSPTHPCVTSAHINAHSLGTSEQTADSKAHRAEGTSQLTAEGQAAKPHAEGKGMSSTAAAEGTSQQTAVGEAAMPQAERKAEGKGTPLFSSSSSTERH
jgi:hypothetical protein